MYRYSKKKSYTSNDIYVPSVFLNWKKPKRKLYPSTIYITIDKSNILDDHSIKENTVDVSEKNQAISIQKPSKIECTIEKIEIINKGVFVVRYSRDGNHLCTSTNTSTVMNNLVIMDTHTLNTIHTFVGHHHFVYDIDWSINNDLLVSASSDGTAKVWNFHNKKEDAEVLLQHTCFVYTCKFHPIYSHVIVTGAHDSIIRFWDIKDKLLISQLHGHDSNINSLEFDKVVILVTK